MMQGMPLKTLFQWQVYFRQRNDRAEAEMAQDRLGGDKTPEQVMDILDRYRGGIGA